MRYIPIIDAGTSAKFNKGYEFFEKGLKDDVFYKINGETLWGHIWPNDGVFIDFQHPKAQDWW